ncbi:alpha/beta hydrolase [Pseudomonas abieticivorans]|uniref:alpha/beta hydrolase n=1 Tax=Pseudomonas abieticivorans TaxID=2931382 RepID=UPI0020BEE225|nr:alpha/beta hydrolase [Pseudomonas sp. PIA16]
MSDYLMSVRAVRNGAFVADVGPTKFLVTPDGQAVAPAQSITAAAWYKAVRADAVWANAQGEPRGDVLFIVHGYNMSEAEVLQRHRLIKDGLAEFGFKGVIVSFDWPSDDKTLAYLPDRHRAKDSAFKLVTDGIAYLSGQQTPTCSINVHVLGHSTGAYVIREAFDDADDAGLPNSAWNVSQMLFAAGDVSSASMSDDNPSTDSLYRHCVRLTNYANRHDQALDISNVKRVGTAPRVGRVGLPGNVPASAVNVDCTTYYERLIADSAHDQPGGFVGLQSHSWYFGNRVFTEDLFAVLIGTDRSVIQTREVAADGSIALRGE